VGWQVRRDVRSVVLYGRDAFEEGKVLIEPRHGIMLENNSRKEIVGVWSHSRRSSINLFRRFSYCFKAFTMEMV